MVMTEGQSYLSKLTPWSRSPVIPPSEGKNGEPNSKEVSSQQQRGGDHRISHRHRLSLKNYPRDCPRLRVQWFHAVDVPIRRPNPAGVSKKVEKPTATPKKYSAFSSNDSKAIEAAFQRLIEEQDAAQRKKLETEDDISSVKTERKPDHKPNTSIEEEELRPGKVKVPVNEDFLFDVDVERRELGPAYWLGPVYDVRRGTWFYQDGSIQKPCDENLAAQLEDGFLKVKAWRLESAQKQRSASQPRARPASWAPGQDVYGVTKPPASNPITPKPSDGNLRASANEKSAQPPAGLRPDDTPSANTHRLFGAHMNSVVTYQDGNTAWILTDDLMSRMSSTMYQRFAGGGHFAGMKVTRGYIDPTVKDEKIASEAAGKEEEASDGKQSAAAVKDQVQTEDDVRTLSESTVSPASETRRETLERHMSSLLGETSEDPAKQEEEVRKRDEKEIQDDYKETIGDDQSREIEHLILVTHGIGQRLGLKLESVNFVHDVNTFRKTLKAVYAESADLQALNNELDEAQSKNCRIQVLPICWRHLLDFPKQSLKHNRREHDLGDSGFGEEEDYPNLDDISVEGVPAVRNLITDLALDILLYQSPAYKDHISRIVLEECNRIHKLFMQRNPTFKGKISMIGHSLGSAIMFDILCFQAELKGHSSHHRKSQHQQMKLSFEVEDFYGIGSPIGLFQMLKGRTIAATSGGSVPKRGTDVLENSQDPFLDSAPTTASKAAAVMGTSSSSEIPVSRPECKQIFNIFHPTDPISYRIEPLISPAMSSLKPQPLPYTKRGIFGAPVGQGFTGIGKRVGQSVSSLWSGVSSGIASGILTRGLGYSGADQSPLERQPPSTIKPKVPISLGAGTNVSAGVIPTAPLPAEGTTISKINNKQDKVAADIAAGDQQHPPTLIDADLETLYGGYEKRRRSVQSDADIRDLGTDASEELAEAEERGKKLKREEEKVRRLNSNGRVDYAIQEGAFDVNIINSIASHLSYWGDEDVAHFMISQLLSRHRVVRNTNAGQG